MTWHLVTFADEKFKEKQDNLVGQGKSLGFTNHVYTHAPFFITFAQKLML